MYGKLVDGTITYQESNHIVIDGTLYICPTREVWASLGYYPVVNVAEDGTDEIVDGVIKHYTGGRTLAQAKEEMLAKIDAYDNSNAVNSFYYNGNAMWLDKATRVGVVNAINAAIALGKTELTIGIGNYSVTLAPADELAMFNQLEMYALECYNVTLSHKNAVNALTTIAEVDAYDYTSGYPEKVSFNI